MNPKLTDKIKIPITTFKTYISCAKKKVNACKIKFKIFTKKNTKYKTHFLTILYQLNYF